MNHDAVRELLQDYVDGSLDAPASGAVESHLRVCSECAEETSRLESLLSALHALSPTVQPPTDLWPGIDARLGNRGVFERTLWSARYVLAAAAIILVVASATVSYRLAMTSRAASVTSGVALIQFVEAEVEYTTAVAQLEDELALAWESLTPEVQVLIEKNLRVIDAAIRETRAALAKRPQDVDVVEMLSGIYRKKLDLLQQANRMAFES